MHTPTLLRRALQSFAYDKENDIQCLHWIESSDLAWFVVTHRSALHDSCATLTILYRVFVLRQIRRGFYIISRHDLLHKAITVDFAFPYGPIASNRFIMSEIDYRDTQSRTRDVYN